MTSMGWQAHASAKPPMEPARDTQQVRRSCFVQQTLRSMQKRCAASICSPAGLHTAVGRTSQALDYGVDCSDLLRLLVCLGAG